MRQVRVWLETVEAGELVLEGERAHYVHHVLRLAPGDALVLLGGEGQRANARVQRIEGGAVVLSVEAVELQPQLPLQLTVALAVPKGDRADWAVEKLTELGVARIVWLLTEHSVVTPRSGGQRQERWKRLAQAAARQAGRASIPELEGPLPFGELVIRPKEAAYVGDRSAPPLGMALGTSLPKSATLLIGPEGGLTANELLQAVQSGYTRVGLGPHTLRVETAAVAGAAVLLGAIEL